MRRTLAFAVALALGAGLLTGVSGGAAAAAPKYDTKVETYNIKTKYGDIYLEVARLPERGWLLAAVGLLGKVLGPIGLARLIWTGAWPRATIVLCLTNDVIWWIPFSLYLYDAWPVFRASLRSERRRPLRSGF